MAFWNTVLSWAVQSLCTTLLLVLCWFVGFGINKPRSCILYFFFSWLLYSLVPKIVFTHTSLFLWVLVAKGLFLLLFTPLDLVKCNMQIDPAKYLNISSGWVPTLLNYSAQGACKFGFYEFFKKYYSDLAGPENAAKYKPLISLAGSASADVALCLHSC